MISSLQNKLLWLLIVIFPFGELLSFNLGNGVHLLVNDVVVGLLALTFLVSKQKKEFKSAGKGILFFSVFAAFSLVLNSFRLTPPEVLVSSFYLFRWVAYACLFFIIAALDKNEKKKILVRLLSVGVLTAILGLIQYSIYPDLRNLRYLGWDEHLFRSFSTFLDPNFFGAILLLTLLLGYSLLEENKKNIVLIGSMFVSFIAFLLTYSRGSYLSFIGGVSTFLFLNKKMKLLFGVLILLLFGVFVLPKNLQSEGVKLLRTVSISARLESSKDAMTIFKDNPLIGVGFNTYRYTQKRYGFLEKTNWQENHAAAGTDNSFLFILATTGVIGLIAYCYLLLKIFSLKHMLLTSSLIAIIIHSLFVNSLFYPWIMEWLWIIVGASMSSTSKNK